MGGITATRVIVPLDLRNRVKHPQCVEKIVAELSDGTEIKTELISGLTRPNNLVAYRIEYKVGPCREGCGSLEPEIQAKGCYNGRIDRVELSNL